MIRVTGKDPVCSKLNATSHTLENTGIKITPRVTFFAYMGTNFKAVTNAFAMFGNKDVINPALWRKQFARIDIPIFAFCWSPNGMTIGDTTLMGD